MTENMQQDEGSAQDRVIALLTALRFLTIIPVTWQAGKDGRLFPLSIYYFPIVGLMIGCGGAVVASIGCLVLPISVAAFTVLFYLAAISGFLHLDGLADSGDGLLSARPREQSLAIMKDSRTGAMGVVVLVFVLIGKYAALSTLPQEMLLSAALYMPLAGRCAIVVTMAYQPYARTEGGLGGLFYSSRSRYAAILGLGILLAVILLHGTTATAMAVFMVLLITVFWFSAFCRKRLGGATGDTLGAVCELTELSVAIGLTAIL